jgi:hypothetical protein
MGQSFVAEGEATQFQLIEDPNNIMKKLIRSVIKTNELRPIQVDLISISQMA